MKIEPCPNAATNTPHCSHWDDGGVCCACGIGHELTNIERATEVIRSIRVMGTLPSNGVITEALAAEGLLVDVAQVRRLFCDWMEDRVGWAYERGNGPADLPSIETAARERAAAIGLAWGDDFDAAGRP